MVRAMSDVNGWAREFGSPGNRGPAEAHSLRDGFLPESEPAMHYACALSKEYNAELFFLHVTEDVWQEPLSTRMQAADFFRLRLAEKRWALEEGVAPGVPR